MRPRILHLSADYPDCLDQAKTRAIQGLIEGTGDQFEHRVISLNRSGGAAGLLSPGRIRQMVSEDAVLACRYTAPPASFAVAAAMRSLAWQIGQRLQTEGWRPALIQGHKLSVEGIMARQLSRQLTVPYVLTLQGNTDQKLLRHRPHRRPLMRRVWHGARAIMAFAPWTALWCTNQLGTRADPVAIIPCILSKGAVIPPCPAPPLIRTAFNLDFWQNKNVAALLAAMALLLASGQPARLEIAGAGSAAARQAVQRLIAQARLERHVRLVGPLSAEDIPQWFNGAALFALPSRRESFGMVFAEALLAGTPVIHPRGAAIDGLFPETSFARAASAGNPRELAVTMAEMLAYNRAIKADLAAAQAGGALRALEPDAVRQAYRAFLHGALA